MLADDVVALTAARLCRHSTVSLHSSSSLMALMKPVINGHLPNLPSRPTTHADDGQNRGTVTSGAAKCSGPLIAIVVKVGHDVDELSEFHV